MGFETHITEFAGLEVLDFPSRPGDPLPGGATKPGPQAWRLDCGPALDADPQLTFGGLLEQFLAKVDTTRVAALVTGLWAATTHEIDTVAVALAAHADRLPALRALFLGEVVREQSDVAYIRLHPVTPVLAAFPRLEHLWLRGSLDSEHLGPEVPLIAPIGHDTLSTLVMQSGGLNAATIGAVAHCDFPALEHLEFYFGEPDYGGNATPADIDWLLAGDRLPNLRHLGLRDSAIQDALAAAVAHAPVVAQLKTLDLSLGALGDDGAAALLAGQPLGHLAKLDLHHHFLSEEMQRRLRQAWPGVEVDLSEPLSESQWGRYIAVAE